MKHRLSITIDEELRHKIVDILKSRQFRNKSHLVECAIYNLVDAMPNCDPSINPSIRADIGGKNE